MRTLKAVAALEAGKATECPLCGRIHRVGLRDCPYCARGKRPRTNKTVMVNLEPIASSDALYQVRIVPPIEFNASVPEAELDTPPIDDSVAFVGQQAVELEPEIIRSVVIPKAKPKKPAKKTPAKKVKAKPHARKK